jgi:hypothetical protein
MFLNYRILLSNERVVRPLLFHPQDDKLPWMNSKIPAERTLLSLMNRKQILFEPHLTTLLV